MADQNASLQIRLALAGQHQVMQAFQQITGAVTRLAPALATLASGAGFLTLTRASINFAETLGKASQIVGISVNQLAGLAYAAELDEVSLSSLQVGLKNFSEWLVKSGQGSRNLREALLEQADIFNKLPEGMARINRATELFGKSGINLIPVLSKSSEELEKLFERGARRSGVTDHASVTATEFKDALSDLKLASEGLAGILATAVLPNLTAVIKKLTEGTVKFREFTRESQTFKIGMEGVGVALAGLTAYKVGGALLGGLAGFIGAGAIKTFSDFSAALRLIPAAVTSAVASIGPLLTTLASLTAVVVAGIEGWKLWGAKAKEATSVENLTRANHALAESIREVIEARRRSGEMSDEEANRMLGFVNTAMKHPGSADSSLGPIAKNLISANPAKETPFQWTKDELDGANKLLNLERARIGVTKELLMLRLADGKATSDDIRFQIERERTQLLKEESNIYLARKGGLIEAQVLDEMSIKNAKELLGIEKDLAALAEQERQKKMSGINSNFRLTEAEKYAQLKAMGEQPGGPDPGSIIQQMQAARVSLLNSFGTVAQQIAHTFTEVIGTAINSISTGLTGLIMGTVTWGQALYQIGNTILTTILQSLIKIAVTYAILAALPTGSPVAGILLGGAIPARAAGGPLDMGQLSIVGERGPELFVPDVAGTIVPADQTERMLSGGGAGIPSVHINYFDDGASLAKHVRENPNVQHAIINVMDRKGRHIYGTG